MPTDSSVNLIFTRLAAQLYYLKKYIFICQNIFIWILTQSGFNSQNMIKISKGGKIAPVAGAILPPHKIFI